MNPFFTPDRLWPEAEKRLHIYLLPDLVTNSDLALLIRKARKVMATFPDETSLIDDQWLHLTVAALPFEVTDIDSLRVSLRQALHGTPAFTLRMGSAQATNSAILLDGDDPDGGFNQLHDNVNAAVKRSTNRTPNITTEPHLALGYGADTASVDSGRISTQLRLQCRPPHALLTINEASLVLVTQNPEEGVYTWDEIERFSLTPHTS